LLVCSIMSISPDSGQVVAVPTNQKAGHVPHLTPDCQQRSRSQHDFIYLHIRWQVRNVEYEKPMSVRLDTL